MKAWEKFLDQQEAELGQEAVDKWLRSLKILQYDACNLYLQAKDSFHALWFEEHIRQKVSKALLNNNNKRIRVHLNIANPDASKGQKPKSRSKGAAPSTRPSLPPFELSFDQLDPYCTFEHFIVNEGDLLPYKLLCNTAGIDSETRLPSPLKPELGTFNPIYLHGLPGSGKTHLLMAAANTLRNHNLNVLYARAETFTQHVVSAIRAGEMNIFRQAYRNSDVLIIDDLDVFSRKTATQEEFFHTFNTLHLAGKQILLSASCTPSELQMIEPRLISRFEWGIVLSLTALDGELIGAMLEKKAAALNFPLHPKVSQFLLQTFKRGSKAVTKALQALILRCRLQEATEGIASKQLTIPQTRYLLKDLIEEEEKALLTPEKIIQHTADYFGIRCEDIQGDSQTRDRVLPRQLAMYFCRSLLKIPFIKIGTLFSRDHSTVMSSVNNIQKSLENNVPEICAPYHALTKKMAPQ
jgi:chromosomal replication initiator protein